MSRAAVLYILRRLIISFITLFVIASVTWLLMQLLPGSPFNDERLPQAAREQLAARYGIDDPLPVQYMRYMTNFVQGDLGDSFYYEGRPVLEILLSRLPISAFIGLQALIVGVSAGLLMGAVAALRHNTIVDTAVIFIAVLGIAVPALVIAPVMQYLVGVRWELLPIAFWDSYAHSIQPSLTIAITIVAVIARFTRTEMLEVLGQDYVDLAKSKGLNKFRVVYRHVVKNSLLPLITIIVPLTVALLTGTVVIEQVFEVPGIGELFVTSITTNDYTLIMGTTMLFATLFVLAYLVQDILYSVVDPRIRLTEEER